MHGAPQEQDLCQWPIFGHRTGPRDPSPPAMEKGKQAGYRSVGHPEVGGEADQLAGNPLGVGA
jgi:hypothetical protein